MAGIVMCMVGVAGGVIVEVASIFLKRITIFKKNIPLWRRRVVTRLVAELVSI